MNILVTGASGFLGQTLCRRLREGGHELVELNSRNCDLTRPEQLEAHGASHFDRIYHLAAWTQAGDFCLHHPGEQWIINQQINTHVLDWWRRRQPQARLICMGTSCGYDPELPLSEEYYLRGQPIAGLFTYAMTKRMLLAGLMALHQQFGLEYLYVIPSTLYGPGYHTDGRQMHFIFDLIRKVLRGHHEQEPVVLWGDGEQRRELVFVGDFVDLLLRLETCCRNTLVNLGAGTDHTIREFAQAICAQVGYDADRIQYDQTRYVGARAKLLVIDKLRGLIAQPGFRSLAQGLAETIAWFQAARPHDLPAQKGART